MVNGEGIIFWGRSADRDGEGGGLFILVFQNPH